MKTRDKVLVLYACAASRLRPTTQQHLWSFRKYSPWPTDYVNLCHERLPPREQLEQYTLVIFHYLLMTNHWAGRKGFQWLVRKAAPVRRLPAVKAMIAQDEFYHADLFCEFMADFGVHCLFSTVPESEWEKVYTTVDLDAVQVHRVLTGYIDEELQQHLQGRLEYPRRIDIGYRTAARPYHWFGRHGWLKQEIADAFQRATMGRGWKTDISTRDQDVILGDAWYDFLLNCKYTLGAESGTSVLDWDGSIHDRTTRYLQLHPEASFQTVEAACFPGMDGQVALHALGPRHLEAALTKTCQILVKGRYNGVLQENVHYVPVERDLSNVEEVLQVVAKDHRRREMVERAYDDIVRSGKYTYRSFVELVLDQAMRCDPRRTRPRRFLFWRHAARQASDRWRRMVAAANVA